MKKSTVVNEELTCGGIEHEKGRLQIWTDAIGPLDAEGIPQWISISVYRYEDYKDQRGNTIAKKLRFTRNGKTI